MTSRSLIRSAALAATLALGAIPLQGADVPVADSRLAALGSRYFAETWKLDPGRATSVGVHDYDAQLGDYSAAGYDARSATAQRFLDDLHAIDPATLTAEASYDYRILEARLQSTLLTLRTRAQWRHDPSTYTSAASGAIYALISRSFAPLHERLKAVVAREAQIPAMLDAGKTNVTSVDATTAAIAKQNITGTIGFFTSVVPKAVAGERDAALLAQFKTANDAVLTSLRGFAAAMDAGPFAHPSGTFAIGPDMFAKMLAMQELEPITLEQYEKTGVDTLAKTKAQFIEVAKQIDPSKTPQQVALDLGKDHPAADQLLATAKNDLIALRKFVIEKKIVTLPPDDNVAVVPTPEFARATTFASMNSPGPLEKNATEAYYNVTPVEPDWSPERKEQHLSFFNSAAFPIISLHEVMPGHYVNFALDKHEQLSTIRMLLSSPSFAEGWAHYDEQMMVDEGWGNGDPRVRLAQLQLALQRECRYLVGLREHTQGLSVDDATKFFEENAFMAAEPSHREALRGTQDPLYGYYTLGKLELLKLRDDYRKIKGARFNLETFHDEFLSHGDPPIAIVRKIMLGADDDGKLL